MDVFNLSGSLVREYEAFSRSFVAIRSAEIRKKVDEGYGSRRFWPAPLVQVNPHYMRTAVQNSATVAAG